MKKTDKYIIDGFEIVVSHYGNALIKTLHRKPISWTTRHKKSCVILFLFCSKISGIQLNSRQR